MNPRMLKIDYNVFQSITKFCKKHGLLKKHFVEQALLEHLDRMEIVYQSKPK